MTAEVRKEKFIQGRQEGIAIVKQTIESHGVAITLSMLILNVKDVPIEFLLNGTLPPDDNDYERGKKSAFYDFVIEKSNEFGRMKTLGYVKTF